MLTRCQKWIKKFPTVWEKMPENLKRDIFGLILYVLFCVFHQPVSKSKSFNKAFFWGK